MRSVFRLPPTDAITAVLHRTAGLRGRSVSALRPILLCAAAAPALTALAASASAAAGEVAPAPSALSSAAAPSGDHRAQATTQLPEAIYTDPVHDARFPASTVVLHIPTHGVKINGLAYLPAGPGPHPMLVICHGLPGNEKNLDLAQAVRRAGWVAVTFNYRGSWGSPGTFSFVGNLDDAKALLGYLRDPRNSASLRGDPKRIAIAGHSMGGWVAAKTAAAETGILGAALISAWDPARPMTHSQSVAMMADDMETLAGVTAESMAAERETHVNEMALIDTADGLKNKPLLVLSADDGLAPRTDALVAAIQAKGGHEVTSAHVATDHGWSDRRIELASRIIRWLQTLP